MFILNNKCILKKIENIIHLNKLLNITIHSAKFYNINKLF